MNVWNMLRYFRKRVRTVPCLITVVGSGPLACQAIARCDAVARVSEDGARIVVRLSDVMSAMIAASRARRAGVDKQST